MDIQNKSEQEAGRSSLLAQVTMCSHEHPEQVNRRQGRNSLLAQVTMCSHGHPEQSEQEAGEEFSASSGHYVFTWTSRTKVNRRQGRNSLLAQVTMCSHPEQK